MIEQTIKDLRYIFEYFGAENQKQKLIEEAREYIQDQNEHEVADVFIVSLQLYLHSKKVQRAVDYKISRTIDRIEQGYYNKNTGRKKDE